MKGEKSLYTRYPIVARALGRVRRASKGILHTRKVTKLRGGYTRDWMLWRYEGLEDIKLRAHSADVIYR